MHLLDFSDHALSLQSTSAAMFLVHRTVQADVSSGPERTHCIAVQFHKSHSYKLQVSHGCCMFLFQVNFRI